MLLNFDAYSWFYVKKKQEEKKVYLKKYENPLIEYGI